MRDFQLAGRSTVHAVNGMAATSHPLATLAAVRVLQNGGNAVDAAVTAVAVLGVIEPMMTGIGGDCFALYCPAGSGQVIGLNGSGRAPRAAETAWFHERGISEIGVYTPHAVTVPGAVDAWHTLLKDHGTISLSEALQPAIRFAEEGFAVTPRIGTDWMFLAQIHGGKENFARHFLRDGMAPSIGAVMKLPALAETLKTIAREGRDGFYTGAIAEDLVSFLNREGGLHSLDDFASHKTDYVDPISTSYHGHDVYEIPPNGQGITGLLMLNMLDKFDLSSLAPLSAERLHLETEASRLAFAVRNREVSDPATARVSPADLLAPERATQWVKAIDPKKAMAPHAAATGAGYSDTTYLTVVDRDRNAISLINSLYQGFGSGLVGPETGVALQNRGACFVVEAGHPNCIDGAKRPLHTIIPGMMVRGGKPVLSFGVMGGDYQPVGHVHVITNLLDFGMDIQEAIDCPRVFHSLDGLDVENGISQTTVDQLQAMGHRIARAEFPVGGGQGIRIDWEKGTLEGGSDPRKDGCALGY